MSLTQSQAKLGWIEIWVQAKLLPAVPMLPLMETSTNGVEKQMDTNAEIQAQRVL
jgi:hypothetical protein